MSTPTLEDLQLFHKMDRRLFRRLVFDLSRDPVESFLTMAFLFWLEAQRLPRIVERLRDVTPFVLNKIADEAMICLNSLAADQPMPPNMNTVFTTAVMGHHIPLEMMHMNKAATIHRIKYFLNSVCARIFTDILESLLVPNGVEIPDYQRLVFPGFPHPVFGDVTIIKIPKQEPLFLGNLWGWEMTG